MRARPEASNPRTAPSEVLDEGRDKHRCRVVSAADEQENRDEQARDNNPALTFLIALTHDFCYRVDTGRLT
jgi:hypothetical protein